jgi:hypothetical protein
MKTYSAESGYVYQYFYEGHRQANSPASSDEFVFRISADRKEWHETSIFLEEAAVRAWEDSHGRALSTTERYAIVKMALFHTFDARSQPHEMRAPIQVNAQDLGAILEGLGL